MEFTEGEWQTIYYVLSCCGETLEWNPTERRYQDNGGFVATLTKGEKKQLESVLAKIERL